MQEYSDLNRELEGWSFLFYQLNYTLLYVFYLLGCFIVMTIAPTIANSNIRLVNNNHKL